MLTWHQWMGFHHRHQLFLSQLCPALYFSFECCRCFPEVCSDKAASTTSKLCVKLFKEMGENISSQDIDTAHRVTERNNAGNPKPIVCRFVRWLVKESLMSHRKEISDVTPAVVGLPEGSPRMQAVLFQAKKVKEKLH